MKENNAIKDKSMDFAVRIVKLYQYLSGEKREFVMSKQILRSGTSIGANIHEAVYAQSTKDFISKMSIALKEAAETEYWLKLLRKANFLTEEAFESIMPDCQELCKMLTAIVKSTKQDSEC